MIQRDTIEKLEALINAAEAADLHIGFAMDFFGAGEWLLSFNEIYFMPKGTEVDQFFRIQSETIDYLETYFRDANRSLSELMS